MRRGRFLSQPVLQRMSPAFFVTTVNHAGQVTEPICAVAAILKDVLPGGISVEAEEMVDVFGARKQVSGVAGLGRFSNEGRREQEQILISKQVDALGPGQKLLVVERIIVRLPVDLGDVEIGRSETLREKQECAGNQ